MFDIDNGGLVLEKRDDVLLVILDSEVEQAVVESDGQATAVIEP